MQRLQTTQTPAPNLSSLHHFRRSLAKREMYDERNCQGSAVPPEVARQPSHQLKIRFSDLAINPTGGNLCDAPSLGPRLCYNFHVVFEASRALELKTAQALSAVEFEAVGRVVDWETKKMKRQARDAGQLAL